MTSAATLSKARNYCARQERAQQEVRDKLYAWGAHQWEVEAIIAQLIGDGFLNEARFAEHFAVSKFRQKGWGRRKIEAALKQKQVSAPCIALGLRSIDPQEQREVLRGLIAKRLDREKGRTVYERDQRVVRYFIARGYDRDEVYSLLNELKSVL
jgi:regulatory protein